MIVFDIFLTVFFIVTGIVNYAYKRTNAYYNSHIMNLDFRNPNIGKIIVLGSTYARYAFDGAKSLKIDISNLTLQSQSLLNDLKNFENIKSKITEKNIVFIVLAPCTLLFEGNHSKIFKFNIPGNTTATFKQKLNYIFPIIHIKKIISLLSDEGRCLDVYDNKNLINDSAAIDEAMKHLTLLWKNMFGLKNLYDATLSDYNYQCIKDNKIILEQLVENCLKKRCSTVIIVPPFSDKLNKYFSDEFVKITLEENVKEVKRKYPKLLYLDYRLSSEFQDDAGLFMDGGFLLNRRGSQILIKKIFGDLKSEFYLNN